MPTRTVTVTCPHCQKSVSITIEYPDPNEKGVRVTKSRTVYEDCPECGKRIAITE